MGSLGSVLPSGASSPIFRRRSPRLSRTHAFGGSFLPASRFSVERRLHVGDNLALSNVCSCVCCLQRI